MALVTLTPTAIENIKRLGLTGGGCSGYKYVLELEDGPDPDDHVLDFDGVKVYIKQEHADKLQNSTIDWVDTLMESGFQIDNPQARRPCGCGTSFDLAPASSAAGGEPAATSSGAAK